MSTIRAKRVLSVAKKAVANAPAKGAAAKKGSATAGVTARKAPRLLALDVPFAMRGVASVGGAKWSGEHGVFVFAGDKLPPNLEPFAPLPYSFERYVQRELDQDSGHSEELIACKPQGNVTPRAHQEIAIKAILAAQTAGRAGFLLADDVGLGKTISAWKAILSMRGVSRVLVVAPLAVLAHWRRTVEAMGDNGITVVILNYDRLGKLFDVTPAARKKIRSKKGLARAGTAPEFDVIVWDESHRCKNPTSARSKLAAKLTSAANFSLWMSATAGQNPLELSYLAPLLAGVTGGKVADLKDFEAWCQSQGMGLARGNYGKWEWRGAASDLAKVRGLLFDARGSAPPAGLRRRPEEIVGWPAINRILAPIELEGEARALYKQAWSAFRQEMAMAPKGRDPKGALAAALRLRQKSSLIRVAGTAELIQELLDNGHQVAVSVAFRETLEMLRTALEPVQCAEIHGGLSAQVREAERMRFQRGEVPVVLFTVEEGISLHQGEHNEVPRSEVIHDLRWSAIQMAQIEGRCHRDGRFAQVYWAYADRTVEERIARVVVRRIHSMKEMIGDDTDTLREIESLLEIEE